MTQEVLKLALEALQGSLTPDFLVGQKERKDKSITAIKEALAQPPQRTWVGLTDEEICMFSMWLDSKPDATVFTAIEAKLKEKNT
jgi:hypothetical protein